MRKAIGVLLAGFMFSCSDGGYLSPGKVAADSRGQFYVAMTGAGKIGVTGNRYDIDIRYIKLGQSPNSIELSPDNERLYATCGVAYGALYIISLPELKPIAKIPTGHSPEGIAVSPDGKKVWVANRFDNNIVLIDTYKAEIIASVQVPREPRAIKLSPDGLLLAAGNFLPAGASTDPHISSSVTLIDARKCEIAADILLTNGAQSLRDLCFSSDGRYIYCTHLLSRYNLPITQLDRGWVNSNALSVVDVRAKSLLATVLLDDVDCGAANPNGLALDDRHGKLYIALSGVHELCEIGLHQMHARIDSVRNGIFVDKYISSPEDISSSLSFANGFKRRLPVGGIYPVSVAVQGDKIAVSSMFTPWLEFFRTGTLEPEGVVKFADEKMDSRRRGELAFADASYCYQKWQSCISCHPDARADALNWDQVNDGIGNPKNTKSMIFSHVTPPAMITGIRESAQVAVRKGILHTLGATVDENLAADIDNYLKALEPVPSPCLVDGKQSEAAKRGEKLYEQACCGSCHNGKYYTDGKLHNVGTGDGDDASTLFDTPALREVWRTAPYLYDGRAVTMREVLREWNRDDRHGFTSDMTDSQINDLAEYVLSL